MTAKARTTVMSETSRPRDFREIGLPGQTRAPAASRRRPAPARSAASGAGTALLGFLKGTLRLCRTRPGEVFGSLAAMAAVVAVALNALGFQVGRHPAPILPKVAIKDTPARKAADKPVQAASLDASKTPAVREQPEAATKPVVTKPAPKADAIADILRADETTASVSPKAEKADVAKPERSVMQAQKALAKLGYGPLKADGVMGSTTRAAIEKFEKDRKLPVKGEAAGRTLRELAARAGLPPG